VAVVLTVLKGSPFVGRAPIIGRLPAGRPNSPGVARHIVLPRGINIGSRNRISVPELRAALEDAGFEDVQTYLQSGNGSPARAG
jgi:hypothetical protein